MIIIVFEMRMTGFVRKQQRNRKTLSPICNISSFLSFLLFFYAYSVSHET